MDTHTPPRAQVVGALMLIVLAAVGGASVISQHHWVTALELLATVAGGFATIGQLDGNRWTRRTRLALFGAAVVLAGAMGLLARMIAHGLLLRGA